MKHALTILTLFISFIQYAEDNKKLTLEDIWLNKEFTAKGIDDMQSMNDGKHFTNILETSYGEAIVKYSYKTGKVVDTILKSKEIKFMDKPFTIEDYLFSKDEQRIILKTDIEHIYRHSTKEFVVVFDLNTKKTHPISTNGKIGLASFSTDGSKIAYVRENNLYYTNLNNMKEESITMDGVWNKIINGAPDWVYEEEFSFRKAFAWSPEGNFIAYYKFNEENVKQFNMETFDGGAYPIPYTFKYPKAGEENSKVSLHVYNVNEKSNKKLDLKEDYEYIPRIKWTPNNNILSVQTLNRTQNHLKLLAVNVVNGGATTILSEKSKTYVDISDNLTFLEKDNSLIWTSDKDGYNHIYHYSFSGQLINQITRGKWDVEHFYGVDEKKGLLFYSSSEVSPIERHIYSIELSGNNKTKLTSRSGTHEVSFSKNLRFYIDEFSTANTPPVITLFDQSGKKIRDLETNAALNKELSKYELSEKMFFQFKTSKDDMLNGWMITPPNFDESKKYPVLMYVYGGPGSQTVTDSWGHTNALWYQYLTQEGYIVVSVDNRGTGARGSAFKKCTYKQLGNLETEDQIEAAKYLGTLPYIDKNRIGIQGWSYGGYMSSLCLFKGADVFKAAIAVAPVTNWKYYDSIYTERYMQTPQENPGYDDNAPIKYVDQLKGSFLLIHGMADDNVHFQNTVELINALNKANKHYDLYIYPNKNHGIYGGNTRYHLYTKITNFIFDNI